MAVRKRVESRSALFTSGAGELSFTQTPARRIAHFRERADAAAATQLAEWVVEVSRSTPVALVPLESAAADPVSCQRVAGAVQTARPRALTGLTVEPVEARSAGVAVVSCEAWFTDASPGARIWSARVVHCPCCTALAIDNLSSWFGLSVVVVVVSWIRGNGVALWEVDEATGAGVAVLPGVVGFAETATGEVLTRAVGELRATVTR